MTHRSLTIGLNLLFIHRVMGGIRNSSARLCDAILEAAVERRELRIRLFVTPTGAEYLFEDDEIAHHVGALGTRCEVVSVPIDPRRKLRRMAYEQLRFRRHLKGLDLLHCFDYAMPYVAPCRTLVTLHDLNYLEHPESFTPRQVWIRRCTVPLSLRLADRVVAISETTKRSIVETFGLPEERLVVVRHGYTPPGTGDRTDRRPVTGKDRYVLCVGTLLAHKNHARLIEAFARLTDREVRLLIAGRDDGLGESLRAMVTELRMEDRVRFVGFVSDSRLEELYAGASMLVFPSLAEGFGLPLLEALGRGLPVACSDTPIFREIAGHAVEYFDPEDPVDMGDSLARVLGDEDRRRSMVKAGEERVGDFSWSRAAESTIQVYEDVAHAR